MIRVKTAYSSPACSLAPGEKFDCAYHEFDREGRERKLLTVSIGDTLEALTRPSDGMIYARMHHDGREWAVRLLLDTWHEVDTSVVAAE